MRLVEALLDNAPYSLGKAFTVPFVGCTLHLSPTTVSVSGIFLLATSAVMFAADKHVKDKAQKQAIAKGAAIFAAAQGLIFVQGIAQGDVDVLTVRPLTCPCVTSAIIDSGSCPRTPRAAIYKIVIGNKHTGLTLERNRSRLCSRRTEARSARDCYLQRCHVEAGLVRVALPQRVVLHSRHRC